MPSVFRKVLTGGLFLAVVLTIVPACLRADGVRSAGKNGRPLPQRTTEPAPPLASDLRLASLQKNINGGIASFSLDAKSDVPMEEVTFTVRVPAGVVFSDGSRERTWTSRVDTATLSLPFDLIVAKDGKYVVSGEAQGSYQGKAVHRGFSFRLLVGVRDKVPKVKDDAIEYPGVPGGGV